MNQTEGRELQLTADGSHTLFVPALDEHYHSVNGAVQEAMHVYIGAGLHQVDKPHVRILEIGFGTGLNAFLTLKELMNRPIPAAIEYNSIERYPLPEAIVSALNYGEKIWPERKELFQALHTAEWDRAVNITDRFVLHKIEGDSNDCLLPAGIDVVYFDAFGPDKQPEMWNQSIFNRLYQQMNVGAVLTTYCAKGAVRRMMKEAGFSVERIPGPPGKREMLRAIKL